MEQLSPFEAVAIAASSLPTGEAIDAIPQHVWDDLHDRGLLRTSRDETGDGYTHATDGGEQALAANLADRAEHFLEKDESGWSVKHSWDCGPDLLACPIHRTAMHRQGHVLLPPGRYRITLVPPDPVEHGTVGFEHGKLEFTPVVEEAR